MTDRRTIQYPANCTNCAAPMRPGKSDPKAWPGTVGHRSGGYCAKRACIAAYASATGKTRHARSKSLTEPKWAQVPNKGRAARTRASKPRIGRMHAGGLTAWWIKIPGVGVEWVASMTEAAMVAAMVNRRRHV